MAANHLEAQKQGWRHLSARGIRDLGISSAFVNTLVHLPPSGTRAKLTAKNSSGEAFPVGNMLHITDMSYMNVLKALKTCN